MHEELLHYIWGHRLIPPAPLSTSAGQRISIIDPGLHNTDAGPDFFNAKIRIDNRIWCGNVEIHVRASDWFRHGHQDNKAYDSVILHVVRYDDCDVHRSDGSLIPQIQIECAEDFSRRYAEFVNTPAASLACAAAIGSTPRLYLRDWLDSMTFERLNEKGARVLDLLRRFNGSWEDAAYVTLARALGTGVNSEPFERLALATPLRFMMKHSDSLTSIEALLFGQAGLIPEGSSGYPATLESEYIYLANKFSLHRPQPLGWKMSRMRPASFPHRRIALLALMIHHGFRFMHRVLDARNEDDARVIFSDLTLSGYWADHITLGSSPAARVPAALSRSTIDVLIINVVVPLLYAYSYFTGSRRHSELAVDILEHLPPERNSLVASFEQAGVSCNNAFTSQALIGLRRNYCDSRKCLYCRIGHRILASKTAL